MRLLKRTIILLAAVYFIYLLVINLDNLSGEFIFQIGLPWLPLTALHSPVWAMVIVTFTVAFVFAVILEMGAWYEYTRTIRLQRSQILALQKALKEAKDD
jgi:hypothetical protein